MINTIYKFYAIYKNGKMYYSMTEYINEIKVHTRFTNQIDYINMMYEKGVLKWN